MVDYEEHNYFRAEKAKNTKEDHIIIYILAGWTVEEKFVTKFTWIIILL